MPDYKKLYYKAYNTMTDVERLHNIKYSCNMGLWMLSNDCGAVHFFTVILSLPFQKNRYDYIEQHQVVLCILGLLLACEK